MTSKRVVGLARVAGIVIALGALVVAGSGVAAAKGKGGHCEQGGFAGPGHGPGHHGFGMMRGFAKLDLSDQQRAKIEQRMTAVKAELAPRRDALRQAQQTLHKATEAGVIDEGAIRAAAAELSRIEADLAIAHARMRQELRALLTPEQQAKLDAMKAERRERRAEPGGDGMRRHRGGREDSTDL